jgi:hypothetical protein
LGGFAIEMVFFEVFFYDNGGFGCFTMVMGPGARSRTSRGSRSVFDGENGGFEAGFGGFFEVFYYKNGGFYECNFGKCHNPNADPFQSPPT